jgi:hypothetical protein
MNDRVWVEVLMAYADDLNRGEVVREYYLEQIPDQSCGLKALLHLTERVKQALVPVQPSPTFVKDLAQQLVITNNRRVECPGRRHWREIFIGAAAVGSALSVIGLVAYLLRSRVQVKTQVASTG